MLENHMDRTVKPYRKAVFSERTNELFSFCLWHYVVELNFKCYNYKFPVCSKGRTDFYEFFA